MNFKKFILIVALLISFSFGDAYGLSVSITQISKEQNVNTNKRGSLTGLTKRRKAERESKGNPSVNGDKKRGSISESVSHKNEENNINSQQKRKSLKRRSLTEVAKKRKVEKELKMEQKEYDYYRACEYGTIEAYINFIEMYPDSDNYTIDIRKRISDYDRAR